MAQDEVSGQQKLWLKLLHGKSDMIPDELVERIKTIEDEALLDELDTQVLFVQSVDKLTLPEFKPAA